ncbi:hypothetical protein GGQ13_002975 [Salinibacter ruber]|jgi:hypothetical protein|uniref:hypothetical protein n=1 Tax=Salinibacter ruber TaxID=146919 RepID=UPI00216A7713|nr:hypothetical protein [Salinibacter ruber]MCS4139520.1 hypothetical protein [Salinibacter ruber]
MQDRFNLAQIEFMQTAREIGEYRAVFRKYQDTWYAVALWAPNPSKPHPFTPGAYEILLLDDANEEQWREEPTSLNRFFEKLEVLALEEAPEEFKEKMYDLQERAEELAD